MLRAVPEADESSIGDDMDGTEDVLSVLGAPSPGHLGATGTPGPAGPLLPAGTSPLPLPSPGAHGPFASPAAMLSVAFQQGQPLITAGGGVGAVGGAGAGAGAGAGGLLPPGTAAAVSRLWSNALPGEYMDPAQMVVR